MFKYIVKRVLTSIPVLLIITMVIFGVVKAMPGDEVNAYLGVGSTVSQEAKEEAKKKLGLDKSVPEQYVRWMARVLSGDLGKSTTLNRPVGEVIGTYVWNSFLLNIVSLVIGLALAIPIGIRQAVKKGSAEDSFWTVFSLVGISVPSFFFGMLLIYFVGLKVSWIPISGMRDSLYANFGYPGGTMQEILDIARHMILPVTVMAFGTFASFSRYMRNAMVEVINHDYVRTARAKGVKEKTVIYKHAFKNAQIPLVTLLGMYIPGLFSGAAILESVFVWPGIGKVLIDSITQRDTALTNACLVFSAVLMIIGNLLSDVCYSLVDPRVKVDG
jgi:peptide/nickel transport system permease protein